MANERRERDEPIRTPLPRRKFQQNVRRKEVSAKEIKSKGPTPLEMARSTSFGVIVICCIGLFLLFCNWYADQVMTLNKRADRAAEARGKKLRNFHKTKAMVKAPFPSAKSRNSGQMPAPATPKVEGLVKRAEPPKAPPVRPATATAPPAPRTPVYYDAERDPQVRARVIAHYRNAARVIERKVDGMGFDRGRKFKTESYDQLIEEIAETYHLTPTQVVRIVSSQSIR